MHERVAAAVQLAVTSEVVSIRPDASILFHPAEVSDEAAPSICVPVHTMTLPDDTVPNSVRLMELCRQTAHTPLQVNGPAKWVPTVVVMATSR